ncbi:hypothetical protein RI129_002891 [Pyrocoelia pectoralis]|uniref:Uncharacterized protein n=1 Tax=Pyrocoelia pectoralis TaxID=417401 RepID=A0AAN7VPP6_9COLE
MVGGLFVCDLHEFEYLMMSVGSVQQADTTVQKNINIVTEVTQSSAENSETCNHYENDDNDCNKEESTSADINDTILEDEIQNNEQKIMFLQAGLTRRDVQMMVLAISLRHNLSKAACTDILDLLKICANINDKSFSSNYLFKKQFDPPDDAIKYVFYCKACQTQLNSPVSMLQFKKENKECSNCKNTEEVSLTDTNYFIMTDISSQIKSLLETKGVFEGITKKTSSIKNEISDITDGELYNNLKKKALFSLTYNFNTDGAPIFTSSKRSMWPIQLLINELPPKDRFKHLIFGGIWIGTGKPKSALLNTIFRCFANNAKKLAIDGVEIDSIHGKKTIKLLPILCSVDSVARPILQCRKQFNGYYGCSWCYQAGTYIKTQIKYPVEDHPPVLRSSESHMQDLAKVVDNNYKTSERGVKGPSSLLLLPYFDIVWSLPPDYMHGVLLGVTRQLCDLWTTYSPTSKNTYYIGVPTTIKKINKRLLSIKPTQNIHRLPRTFNEKSKWKASEWKSWCLYYALPCLSGILGTTYLNHFALLVKGIFILLQERITSDELLLAENIIQKFVKEVEKLYGIAAMTFNMHSLLHLAVSVRKTGPLWTSSAFPYESGIYKIKQQIKGPVGVEKQITKKMLTINTCLLHLDKTSYEINEKCVAFCTSIFHYNKNLSSVNTTPDIVLIGTGSLIDQPSIQRYLELLNVQERIDDKLHWFSYKKCIFKKVMYHTNKYLKVKKTNDTIIQTKSGEFAEIIDFINCDFGNFMVIKIFNTQCQSYGATQLTHLHKTVSKSNTISIIPINEISNKCMLLQISESEYICQFPNMFEIQ